MKHLVTPRLLMRPFSPEDLADLYVLYSDPNVMKYITGGTPRTLEETRAALERMMRNFEENEYGMFAVFERKEKRFIGRCGLQPLEESGLIELGYTLLPSAWGKGYATEAAMQVIRTAFSQWGLEKIVAIAREENKASTRVMEKIGMTGRSHEKFYGQDVVMYSLEKEIKTASDFYQSSFPQSSRLSMPAL